jgi:ComF family protein
VGFDRVQQAAGRLFDPLLAVVFPSCCPACGALLAHPASGPLCQACWASLPRHRSASCRCGLPLLPGRAECGRCRRGRQPFAAGASLGPYEGPLRVLLLQLKFAGRRRAAARLASLLLEDAAVGRLLATSDLLVPVPLHPRRLRERGFNQSALIAQELARRAGRPVSTGALVRRRDTAPQSGLRAAERRRNVRDAFVVGQRAGIAGRVVTVVDDVVTTGATARACALALAEAGAAELRLLSAARA